jgi:PleD family two-component response regulator
VVRNLTAKNPDGSGDGEIGAKQCSVLVIDDSEIARAKMVELLSAAGMKVTSRASPIGATRAIMSSDITVVVIDVLMPGMRGDRLAALFRGNPRLASLGVVLVSGESDSELNRLRGEVGADAVVSKTNLKDLAAAVVHARRRRAAMAER